ncbi:tyrosine-protein phosphatase 99A isoform X1 [Neodiprion pinetum]|uniref:protein-tyrosine-phosphatase n=1 Tax=Neodiprion lecontei TaxID=441921 RepID=A0ABM3G5T3_NEOLC|nr:tyrosine-protein phosphatase 99A isoform X1 [Neodiprion pinetum]XP_046595626.1 tyrosine-protein phosphatase 99A isoform X1 [Neodiprion lecontei]
MDLWKNGQLIYAYFIWILVRAVAAGRVFDVTVIPLQPVNAEAGGNISLACPGVTEQSLVLMLEWRANGAQILQYSSSSTTVWKHRNRVSLIADNFALFFHPVTSVDSGEYYCLVNNRPMPEAIVKLMVQDVPDPPGRPLIMAFTSRSVNLSWAASANSHNNPISNYVIYIRVGEDGSWDEMGGIETPTNDTTYTIQNLIPFTVYSFRIAAVNAMGRSLPSKESYYMVTLREVPDGKPTITTAHNTSATSILITWRPPNRDTIHGEFLGYRIAYRPRDRGNEDVKEIYIRDANVESHTIHSLETYTQYLVSLQVFNPEGLGPSTTVLVMTDEGVPTKPLNLTVHHVTSSSIELSWAKPENANGIVMGYRIYYMHSNYTDVKSHKNMDMTNSNIYFNLSDLKPYTEYKIWVKAYTWKNEGEPSDHIIHKTDIAGPSAPNILNLTCQAQDVIYFQWQRPGLFWNSIDFYYIRYRVEGTNDFEEIPISADKEHLESGTTIQNLSMNTVYEVTVRGATRSVINPNDIIVGESSPRRTVSVEPNCDKIPPSMRRSSKEFSAGVIAGMVCACFAVMLAITSFVLWRPCLRPMFRKCFHTAYYYLDDPPRNVPTLQDWENTEQDGERTAVAVQNFAQHVAALHADGDIGFSKEYELIQSETGDYTVENSQYAENKTKNRYLNILAYDHTRVQLLSCGGGPPKKGQDYVNANYIDGWQRSRAYIGTQGPLPPTFDAFWRMVWEQRVSIIVMITNLVERGRRKCDMYWPKEGTETYGHIQVTLMREDIMATYTVRTLHIRHLKQIKKKKSGINMGERTVLQYHYTGWPDHGVPDHPLPVLSFVRKSSNANPPDAGPIIVHCSAGVGRTGTYIVIDAMLKQAKSKGEINVFGFLKHIRTQRNFLVQTEEQYIFIHDALQEAIESGETNIEANSLLQHVRDMLCPNNNKTDPWNSLDAQYKLVTSWKPKDFNLVSATKPCNAVKNRNMEALPIENARVHLTPKPGIDGSDYINATWLAGFQRNREFILTQHPMENTIMEFWQMVWDHNAQTIVMLTHCEEDYPEFWPTEGKDLESETFRVRLCGIKETVNGVVLREVAVRSLQDDYELSARIVQGPLDQGGPWPHNNNPKLFVNVVQDFHRDYQNGPIIVMDRYGGIEGGLFVILTTLNKQLEFEQTADIYMSAKLLYMKRPGIFRSKEDYILLYQCLESMLSPKTQAEPDLYMTANGHVTSMSEGNEAHLHHHHHHHQTSRENSMQHIPSEFSAKTPIREYTTSIEMTEYPPEYVANSVNERISNHVNEHGALTGSVRNSTAAGANPLRNSNISQGSAELNGYVSNGSTRVPPEGMESTCVIVPP